MLRGVKPSLIEQRLKLFLYGEAGAGKTTAAISFPTPYVIDCESGTAQKQYIRKIEEMGGLVYKTHDFDDVFNEITTLLTIEHPYKTLVIDPLTLIYEDLVRKSAIRLRNPKDKDSTGEEFGRHYGLANNKMKNLIALLTRLDMNVIITSQVKKEYGDNMKVIGTTFDCYKKLDYLFDLVLEIQKRSRNDRVAIVKKTRIEEFPDGDVFSFNYEEIAKRYGKTILEKDAVPEVLATKEQIEECKRYVELLHIKEEVIEKWFGKANCTSFENMNSVIIEKIIVSMRNQINGENK